MSDYQHIATRHPRARKAHRCEICDGIIAPGTRYTRTVGLECGELSEMVTCWGGACVPHEPEQRADGHSDNAPF
jgi:hypothetical protein